MNSPENPSDEFLGKSLQVFSRKHKHLLPVSVKATGSVRWQLGKIEITRNRVKATICVWFSMITYTRHVFACSPYEVRTAAFFSVTLSGITPVKFCWCDTRTHLWMSIENTVSKPGFQIYAYLVSYVLSTSTNMQFSSYKRAIMPTVPAMTNVNMSNIYWYWILW